MKFQEEKYLNILRNILENGKDHKNRTGVNTKRCMFQTMDFDISQEFPLLTTKRVYWKGVVHELLWFLSGSTNNKYLRDHNVNIWTPNAQDHYSKLRAMHKESIRQGIAEEVLFLMDYPFYKEEDPDELGPVYGFQWRHFNGEPQGLKDAEPGFDQISWAIDQIKNNPESRRIIISAWNPLQMYQMALPPCHVMSHFIVADGRLNCTVYIRSNDFFLGAPFNIASYALMTYMFSTVCGLKPGHLFYIANDAHLYQNQLEQSKIQLKRQPRPFPKLKINNKKNIFDIKYEDIYLENYNPHPPIKADMVV